MRVVPNLYPAFERQEVVVHTPRHVRTFAELDDAQLHDVAEAWRLRREAEPDGYLHALINEGRTAGASLAHTHSQLVWLRDVPPEVERERHGGCAVCSIAQGGALVEERDGLLAVCPAASRVPYELLLAPAAHEADALASSRLAGVLVLLRDCVRRLRAVEGPVPWNAWVHVGEHWHVEVMPRLTVFAGIELGAGIYVNTLDPAVAAAALREAS